MHDRSDDTQRVDLHIHLHADQALVEALAKLGRTNSDPANAERLGRIEAKLDALLVTEQRMNKDLEDLLAVATEQTTLIGSVKALSEAMEARLIEQGLDAGKVASALSIFRGNEDALKAVADSLTANTPAEPVPTDATPDDTTVTVEPTS